MRRCVTVLRRCRPGLVKSPTDYKVTETSAAETTPVGTASQSITVEDTSAKVPAVSERLPNDPALPGSVPNANNDQLNPNRIPLCGEMELEHRPELVDDRIYAAHVPVLRI